MITDDGVLHNPRGAAAYYYEDPDAFYGTAILMSLGLCTPGQRGLVSNTENEVAGCATIRTSKRLVVHVGCQPNNSPHIGTITVLSYAGFLAQKHKTYFDEKFSKIIHTDLEVIMSLDLVDTAPDDSKTEIHQEVTYQRSHRPTSAMDSYLADYDDIIARLRGETGEHVRFRKTLQQDLLSHPRTAEVLNAIISAGAPVSYKIFPKNGRLGLRAACPASDCGRADKHGVHTKFYCPSEGKRHHIVFHCYLHGDYEVDLDDPDGVKRLEMNTPLRNLVRTYVNGLDTTDSGETSFHLRVTGCDHSGIYQEQMLFAFINMLSSRNPLSPLEYGPFLPPIITPVIVYVPLITDWAGTKISKSLYLRKDAYHYLNKQDLDIFLSYARLRKTHDIRFVFDEVQRWIAEPRRASRSSYSLNYFVRLFSKEYASSASGLVADSVEGLDPSDDIPLNTEPVARVQ